MFCITIGGCRANHPAPFTLSRPRGIPEHLLLFVHTNASFEIGGDRFRAVPGEMILVQANTPYAYHSLDSHYMDDWFHFLCSPEELAELAELFHKPIAFGNPSRISNYLPQLFWEYNEQNHKNCDRIFRLLLDHAKKAVERRSSGFPYSPYLARFQELRLQLLSNPTGRVSASDISKKMGISASYFEHLYSEIFHISFRKDLIVMRISYAKELLAGTPYTIAHVAEICGYPNEVHFYRQFRKTTGMTPAAYRRLTFGEAASAAEE